MGDDYRLGMAGRAIKERGDRDQGERETELEKISQVGEDEHVAEMSSSKMQWAQQACLSFIHASLVPRCSKSESSLALPEVLDVRTPF